MPKTFTVAAVPGATRKSDRDYTHAVVGRHFYSAATIDQRTKDAAKSAGEHFDYMTKLRALGVGGQDLVTGCARPWHYTVSEKDVADASEFFARVGEDRAAYVSAAAVREFERCKASNERSTLIVCQWSQSERNARNAVGSWQNQGYIELAVVPTVLTSKPKLHS